MTSMLRRRKKIHFVRHAESEHNIPPYDNKLRDPYLSPHGRRQAEALGQQFPNLEDVDLVVCSPMKRAILTAVIAFGDHLRPTKTQIIALPELQELSAKPCDTGSSLAELLTEFREDPLDLDLVPHDWDSKDRLWSPTEVRTLARMARARSWLRDRPEDNIVVIGHAHCLQLLVRDAPPELDNDGIHEIKLGLLPVWRNCELRIFAIEEDEAHILLFEETRTSRKLKARGENVPWVSDAEHSRKDSQTSHESSRDGGKQPNKSRWTTLSRSSSRAPSTTETSPATSIRKSLSWPAKTPSLKEPHKVSCLSGNPTTCLG
jgi:broad specificity phosphatase PhoE